MAFLKKFFFIVLGVQHGSEMQSVNVITQRSISLKVQLTFGGTQEKQKDVKL